LQLSLLHIVDLVIDPNIESYEGVGSYFMNFSITPSRVYLCCLNIETLLLIPRDQV